MCVHVYMCMHVSTRVHVCGVCVRVCVCVCVVWPVPPLRLWAQCPCKMYLALPECWASSGSHNTESSPGPVTLGFMGMATRDPVGNLTCAGLALFSKGPPERPTYSWPEGSLPDANFSQGDTPVSELRYAVARTAAAWQEAAWGGRVSERSVTEAGADS